jgi:RNA polymerase sigma-70 factor (ECF subfamily)
MSARQQSSAPLSFSPPALHSRATRNSDQNLIESIAAGNTLAMRALFVRYNARVFCFVRRLVDDPSTAEDIVTDTFFEVWRHANRFEGRSQVSTWLLAIARLKALSELRQRRTETFENEIAESIVDEADDPEVALTKKDDVRCLRACIERLSPEHREVINLVYRQEKSVNEAAKIVGVPRNTIKTRMFYARRRIATFLEEAAAPTTGFV